MSPAAKAWVARGVTVALGLAIWLWPVPEGLTAQAWHLFAIFAATIFSVIVGAFPILTASVLAVAVCGPLGHPPAREGLRRVRERHDPPHRRRLPRRARDREVRPRAAARPPRRGALRKVDARARLQHLLPRRRHRARVPERHGALGRPLPARPLPRRGLGLEAGRGDAQEDGRLPDVLRDGDAQPLVGALADGDGGQPARRRDRQVARLQRVVRLVARRLDRPDARLPRGPPVPDLQGLSARAEGDARGARGGEEGARRDGAAEPAREDRRGDVRRDGHAVGARRNAQGRPHRRRLPRSRHLPRDGRPDAQGHRPAGRRPRDVHLVRDPLRDQRPAQHARLHGLDRPAARGGARRPAVARGVRPPRPRLRPASTTSS